YIDHPIEFTSRLNQVSIFASGWLVQQQEATGQSAAAIVLQQVWRAALLPFHTWPQGWYHTDAPLVGPPVAVLMAIGLAVVSVGAFRRQYFGLAVAYWGAVLGVGLTDVPAAPQRFVITAPLIAILVRVGLGR